MIVPKENKKDLKDIPKVVLKALRIVLVEHMDEVLHDALVIANPDSFLKRPSEVIDWREEEEAASSAKLPATQEQRPLAEAPSVSS